MVIWSLLHIYFLNTLIDGITNRNGGRTSSRISTRSQDDGLRLSGASSAIGWS